LEKYERGLEPSKVKLASELYDREVLELAAWQLIKDAQKIEHDHWEQEPEVNARTGIFEELTAKGHLSHIESSEHPDIVNQRTLQRLVNGYSDRLPKWEQERRFYEIVEELINHAVWADMQAGNLPLDTIVITISNFPDDAPEIQASQIGYGVLNNKGMVRATDFEGSIRTTEQISRSNSNDHSTGQYYQTNGLSVQRANSTGYLSSQIITTKRTLPDGAVDVQRALDGHAGSYIIYGEDRRQADLNLPGYEQLREISQAREEQAEPQIKRLAEFERRLNVEYQAGLMTYEQKLKLLNRERKKIVNEVCLLEPAYAKDARGAESARHFEQAALAMAAGNDVAGMQHFSDALRTADPRAGAVCGGDGFTADKLGLDAESTQTYLNAKQERKNWKWKTGICIVKECPTRPDKTKVGPCSVCRNCQTIFDKGDNPKSIYKVIGFMDLLFQSFQEDNQKYKARQEQKRFEKIRRAEQEALKRAA